jgi:hypothetical protein
LEERRVGALEVRTLTGLSVRQSEIANPKSIIGKINNWDNWDKFQDEKVLLRV